MIYRVCIVMQRIVWNELFLSQTVLQSWNIKLRHALKKDFLVLKQY